MEASTIIETAKQIDYNQIIDKIDTLYSNSWHRFIDTAAMVSVGVSILIILMPILIQLWQRHFFKIEEEKIKRDLTTDINRIIEQKFKDTEKIHDEKFAAIKADIVKYSAEANAGVYHVQASYLKSQNLHVKAIESCVNAVKEYLKFNDPLNLRRTLEGILKRSLKEVTSRDIELLAEEGTNLEAMFTAIVKKYTDGSFDDLIVVLRKELKTAKNRTPAEGG